MQLLVVGAEPGTAVHNSFASRVLSGPGETCRKLPILNSYWGLGTEERIDFRSKLFPHSIMLT